MSGLAAKIEERMRWAPLASIAHVIPELAASLFVQWIWV